LIVYFDTSAVVPLVVDEPTSEAAGGFWSKADRIVSSMLLYAEARAALAQAGRLGRLDQEQLRRSVDGLERVVSDMDLVEVTDPLVRRAGALAEDLGLRGFDAVHLASAELVADDELVLVAGDKRLVAAAGHLGLATARLG
jgi:predicted nucleic acid-binding protein